MKNKDDKIPSYWVVIPANIRYNKNISSSAKLLYGELIALSNKYGYAFPSNKWLGGLYGISSRQVTRLISELVTAGLVRADNYNNGKRKIYVDNNDHVTSLNVVEYVLPDIDTYGDHSITRLNIKDNNSDIKSLFSKVYKKSKKA